MFKPTPGEYAAYYEGYVSLVDGSDGVDTLIAQTAELRSALASLPEERGTYRYADGKWTIKELVSHVIDAERVFAYRLLRIARGDQTPLPGYDQDPYIETSNANNRSFASLVDEFDHVRRSNVLMIEAMDDEALLRTGTASDNAVSARALIAIMLGHARHHQTILVERYLG
jgi:uncharacterized damage-inducible protein DinB